MIRFGHYRLDRVQGLRRGDAEVRVTPKSLAVLSVLAERAGQVVTKEELFRAAWPDAAVSDAALTSCIQELRQALEDDPRRPRYIETMHRRGYRFLAPVEQAVAHNENSDATPVAGHPHFHRWRLLGAGLLILIASAILGSTLLRRDLPPAAPASLLVLPFQSLDAGPMDNRLGEGISEQLTAKLMSLPGLRLVSPEAAYRVHAATTDPAEAGRRLNAEAVLVGSVRTADRKVRVNAQLIRTIDRRVLWAEGGLELEARDLLEAESVLATDIATRLRGSLTPRERTELARAPTSDAEAYELFVRGRLALRAARDRDEFRIAEQLFEQALQRDPDFGQALAWLALTQARIFMRGRAGDDTRKASIENARKALALDPSAAVARRALITVFHSTGQAEEGLREASILLKSGAADSDTLAAIAHAYMRAGMPDRAVTLWQRALAADPEDAATLSLLAMSAHMAKQHEFGLPVLEGQPPEFAPLVRVLLAIASGKHELARSVGLLAMRNPSEGELRLAFIARMLCDLGEGETVRRVLRERLPALERDAARLSNERVRIGLGMVYSILGDRRRAHEQVRLALEINPGDPWTLYYGGEIHAQLGDERRAIDCLQQAAARGFLSPVYLDWSSGSLYRLREHPEVREWRRSLEAKVAALRKQY